MMTGGSCRETNRERLKKDRGKIKDKRAGKLRDPDQKIANIKTKTKRRRKKDIDHHPVPPKRSAIVSSLLRIENIDQSQYLII